MLPFRASRRSLSLLRHIRYVNELDIDVPPDHLSTDSARPAYRVLNEAGTKADAGGVEIKKEDAVKYYETMIRLNCMDKVFYDAQRQGRISFYMTSYGEEAACIGSAAGLSPEDEIFAQYREQGVLMYRGFPLQRFADQMFGNSGDSGMGRQMPVHYGSKEFNFQTISSPLATQIPQAVGAAYGFKIQKKNKIVACYFGDGAASEGDFHAGMNFAATLACPVLFFCRNNGYAISTPVSAQYHGDGIVAHARGYGMASIRVDGNDVFAVKEATQAARALALKESVPVFLEAMTYRQGHHSTSDDSTRYRSIEEIEEWTVKRNPIDRLFQYLQAQGWMTLEQSVTLKEKERQNVLDALVAAEQKPKHDPYTSLFEDVYDVPPENLIAQRKALEAHVAKYPHLYHKDGSSH